jgi:hypothetical protein
MTYAEHFAEIANFILFSLAMQDFTDATPNIQKLVSTTPYNSYFEKRLISSIKRNINKRTTISMEFVVNYP